MADAGERPNNKATAVDVSSKRMRNPPVYCWTLCAFGKKQQFTFGSGLLAGRDVGEVKA
jgi:hypothetical protein